MNKEEAIKQLKNGKKIIHKFFEPGEYIYMINNWLYDEMDCPLNFNLFWLERTSNDWNKDWKIK